MGLAVWALLVLSLGVIVSISERVPMPAEMFGEVTRGFDRAGPDNEPQSRLVKCLEVGHRQHAGVGDHHHFAELVSGHGSG